ncbi:MAG: DUF4129 domain-containing protein [Defluviitaleaceae bacterium]|nr:DUF4129 domain-containing protein [Defluviitaleaceae bacterium]
MTFYEAMNEVLQTSRYDFLMGRRVDFQERFWELISRILEWLFSNLEFDMPQGGGVNAGLIATIFAIVGIVLTIIALFVLIRTYLRTRRVTRHELGDIFEEIRNKNYTVSELIELSQKAENTRIAVRYRYIAAILSLNERDIIKIEPSATNAIILRQIRNSSPELAPHFYKIAETFHLAWFGHKSLGEDSMGEFISAVDKVVNHA